MAQPLDEAVIALMEKAISEMSADGALTPEVVDREFTVIACEWARSGNISRAGSIISTRSEGFLSTALVGFMQDDPEFRDMVFALATMLVERGIVDISSKFQFERPPALA